MNFEPKINEARLFISFYSNEYLPSSKISIKIVNVMSMILGIPISYKSYNQTNRQSISTTLKFPHI